MPIKDLSDTVRLPRLGKIHLGYRHPEKGYPIKTDYFVFPKEHSDYKKLVETFGEKPKELRILIPVEDEELWATQYYKAYSLTRGLICKGDGEVAMRMVDAKTGGLPEKETGMIALTEMTCAGKECPEYKAKKCGETMNLRFVLPEVPGLGIWQIDTGSINSILNINSCANMIKKAFGRVSLIPLKLTLEPIEVNNPETGKKQTVYVMHLRTTVTIAQLADAAREQAKTLMLSPADWDAEFEKQVQNDIDTLWGDGKLEPKVEEKTKPVAEKKPAPAKPPEPPQEATKSTVVGFVDTEWLTASMKKLKWQEKTLTTWIAGKIKGLDCSGKLSDVLGRMTKEQAEVFTKELQSVVDLK